MSFPFNADRGLILVTAILEGPWGAGFLRLALDTGATDTTLGESALRLVGYELPAETGRVELTTGSGSGLATPITVRRLNALGHTREEFPVLGLELPLAARVDGLIGLDFLRGLTLTVDFRRGQIDLR